MGNRTNPVHISSNSRKKLPNLWSQFDVRVAMDLYIGFKCSTVWSYGDIHTKKNNVKNDERTLTHTRKKTASYLPEYPIIFSFSFSLCSEKERVNGNNKNNFVAKFNFDFTLGYDGKLILCVWCECEWYMDDRNRLNVLCWVTIFHFLSWRKTLFKTQTTTKKNRRAENWFPMIHTNMA